MVHIKRRGVKTFYLSDADLIAGQYDTLAIAAPSGLEEAQGWVVDNQTGTGCQLTPDTVRPTVDFGAVLAADAAFTELGYRTTGTLHGTFAAGDWVLSCKVKCNAYHVQRGFVRYRLWRSANADGTSATQVTSAWATHTGPPPFIGAIMFTGPNGYATKTITVNLGAVSLSHEYLFMEVDWIASTIGGDPAAEVAWVHNEGAAERLLTPVFRMSQSPLRMVTPCR